MPAAPPPVDYTQAQKLLDLGHNIRYIAKALDCSTQALYYGVKVGKLVRHAPPPAE